MTKISDLVLSPMFADYFRRQMIERSTFIKSGIAATDNVIAARCAAGVSGTTVTLPFFNTLDNAKGDETLEEDTDLNPDKIDAAQDVAVIVRRGKAFASTDLAADLSGQDPLVVIAGHLADYWNKMRQIRLMKLLDGVFAKNVASDSSSLVLDLSANTMGKTDIMLGAQKLGDRKLDLTAVAMNSAVETYLAGLDTNGALYRASQGPATLPSYNGRSIIVDDNIPYNAETGVATIYLFGPGAIALNDVPERVPFETDRAALKGNDILITRVADIMHLRGYKWTGTSFADATYPNDYAITSLRGQHPLTPRNSDLATAGNWSRVYDPKEIRCVKLLVKIA